MDQKYFPKRFPAQHQDCPAGYRIRWMSRSRYLTIRVTGGAGSSEHDCPDHRRGQRIGRAAAVAFVKEGADVAIAYLNERSDAEMTKQYIENMGGKLPAPSPGMSGRNACAGRSYMRQRRSLGKINILVNNAGVPVPQQRIQDISEEQLYTTFEVNVFSMFYFVKAVLEHGVGCESIINTASVTAYQEKQIFWTIRRQKERSYPSPGRCPSHLQKGISGSTQSLRGPIWHSAHSASFSAEKVARFGQDVPMRGQASHANWLRHMYILRHEIRLM